MAATLSTRSTPRRSSRFLSESARLLFAAKSEFCLIGTGDWDQVALVEYPNRQSLLDMSRSEESQGIHHHREAGLEGQINYRLTRVV